MRTSTLYPIVFTSLLLAPLAGCDPATPTPTGDAATPDTPVVMDGPATDAPPDRVGPTDVLPSVDSAPMGECGFIDPSVRAHVVAMSTMGWGALNRGRSMMMWGCNNASRPQDCLASVPLAGADNIGDNRSAIPAAHLRVLYTANTRSNFWTRGSADGRFVGRGVYVHDLSRDVEMRATGAMFDPAFFPDNSGFTYQPNGRMCPMSMLTTGMPTAVPITGASSACTGSSIGLYQHLGTSLDGADYWATAAGSAAWDDGGHMPTLQETRRNEAWGATAQTQLTLMASDGAGFTAVGTRNVRTPYQGDAVISPSSRLLITRFGNTDDARDVYRGYILNRLDASHEGAAITASVTEIGRYCVQGAKPAFSYDERYITFHHYVGGGHTADADAQELGFADAADAGFAEYATNGASNIYIMDLLTGRTTRVTTMGPGQYALYPFFRNDGWIYFIVRTLGTTNETVVASDAALLQ
jgi:hypothetical protein